MCVYTYLSKYYFSRMKGLLLGERMSTKLTVNNTDDEVDDVKNNTGCHGNIAEAG